LPKHYPGFALLASPFQDLTVQESMLQA
jgi:hypothetical protein